MQLLERFTLSAKGSQTEDLILETPHYFGVFDGVTGTRDWSFEGKTMGQWGAQLAAGALEALGPESSIQDFARSATAGMAAFRDTHGLLSTDRLAACAIVLPRRRPFQVWSIGDSHYGYCTDDGAWHDCAQTKHYDEVTLAYRRIIVTQEIMERGLPDTPEARADLAQFCWESVRNSLSKQMLWANHPDPDEKLGFGVLSGRTVPPHALSVFDVPDTATEIVLCSDGFPGAPATAAEGRAVLDELRAADPFLTGRNRLGFVAHRGGFVQLSGQVAECYDDVSYVRITV